MAKHIEVRGKSIEISFPYDEGLIDVARALPDRKFKSIKRGKFWTVPATPWHANHLIEVLAPLGFEIDKSVKTMAKEYSKVARPAKVVVPKKGKLYPFQVEAVQFIEASNGRCLIGEEMGLGKTVEALAWMHLRRADIKRAIIVAPANVIYKWEAEVKKWLGWQVEVVEGSKTALPSSRVLIMSYAIMTRRYKQIKKAYPSLLILDEAHAVKNRDAQRSRAVKSFLPSIPHVLMLTGTPFLNRPKELFNLLHMLRPAEWPNFFPFGTRYCNGQQTEMGWDFNGSSNEQELKNRLKSTMIRRLKTDVLDELPDLTRARIPVKIINKADYNKARREAVTGLNHSNALTRLNQLRQIVGKGKVAGAASWADNFLAENPKEKLVIYCHHLAVVESLANKLASFGVGIIQGSVSAKKRAELITKFQEAIRPRVMIITAAGGEGIDLWRASNLLFVERDWTPAREEQVEARLHRMGQKNAVTAWYLVAQDTLDVYMDEVIESKRQVFKDVLTAPDVKKEILNEVLESILEE